MTNTPTALWGEVHEPGLVRHVRMPLTIITRSAAEVAALFTPAGVL